MSPSWVVTTPLPVSALVNPPPSFFTLPSLSSLSYSLIKASASLSHLFLSADFTSCFFCSICACNHPDWSTMVVMMKQQFPATSPPSSPLSFLERLAYELAGDRLVLRLRVAARVGLLTIAFISLLFFYSTPVRAIFNVGSYSTINDDGVKKSSMTTTALFLHEMAVSGLLKPGDRTAFLASQPSEGILELLQLLIHKYRVGSAVMQNPSIDDGSLDFFFSGVGGSDHDELDFTLISRELKVGGVAALRYKGKNFPPNFRMVYTRSFYDGSIIVAIKKTAEITNNGHYYTANKNNIGNHIAGRRLLSIPEEKKEILKGLEGVMLEPPSSKKLRKRWRTRYLPELIGDTLERYPRRVFVDVGSPGRSGSEGWFRQHYPMGDHDFEFIRVDVVDDAGENQGGGGGGGGMSEWVRKNVRDEEYVVVKAEAEVVEEMVKGKTIGLVDELFLECKNQWMSSSRGTARSRRAYWECLALYGKLRDQGVAVHQWWGW